MECRSTRRAEKPSAESAIYPENNPLYPEMLVSEYLDFVGRLRELAGPARQRAIDEGVAATGLEPVFHRPVGELSKGFRQRVGLAAAILHRPDLLILDEPTEGLDPNQRVEIRRLIGQLGRDRTVLLSTHVLAGAAIHLLPPAHHQPRSDRGRRPDGRAGRAGQG